MSLALDWLRIRQGEDPMVHMDDVFRYAYARLRQREDAEDVAVEVVQALPNPCKRDNLRLYMIGMARRKVADRMRMQRTSQLLDTDAVSGFDQRLNQAAAVADALHALTDGHREVLVMKYVIGLSSAEIGDLTGKQSTAVDSLLQRARDAFAKEWESTEVDR